MSKHTVKVDFVIKDFNDEIVITDWETDFFNGSNMIICPYCRSHYEVGSPEENHYNYCPNCGRKLITHREMSIDEIRTDIGDLLNDNYYNVDYGSISITNIE